jgi:hypothetical protein
VVEPTALQQQLAHLPKLHGAVSSLRLGACGQSSEEGTAATCTCTCGEDCVCSEVFSALCKSSCMPKPWMQQAFVSLYAPMHLALDIPKEAIATGKHTSPGKRAGVAAYGDGLGEEAKPFEHLLVGGDHKSSVRWEQQDSPKKEKASEQRGGIDDIDEDEDDLVRADLPEGDDDAFRLISALATALSRIETQAPAAVAAAATRSPSPDAGGLMSCVDSCDVFASSDKEAYSSVLVYSLPSAEDMASEIVGGLQLEAMDNLVVLAGAPLPSALASEDLCGAEAGAPLAGSGVGGHGEGEGEDVCSASFLEAFKLVTSPTAHELTGATFTWKIIGVDSFAASPTEAAQVSYGQCRFRVTVKLTSEMEDAICDRSMHNSMHNVEDEDASSDEDELACKNGDKVDEGDEEDDDEDDEEEGCALRKVSRRLRARLLSLCGSVAYLLGDAMGGYQ